MANFSDDSDGFGNYGLETIDTPHSERVSSSRVIDLRRHPRVDTWFPARMISEYGKVDGFVTNLSRSGLRFEGDKDLPELLMKEAAQDAGHSQVIVEIRFYVPAQDAADRPIVVQARSVYVIDNDDGNYMCGIEFKTFAEGEQALVDYLHTRGVAA
ncbi:MAG: PilZ domain-containing protein [Gammaproteobacteria bacterium]|nr:MAG: PilZ domain-containing protein [Gammaproteobacteria bacterium]